MERPGIPWEPTPFKADENLWGLGGVPPKPDLPGASPDEGIASKRPASEGEAQGTEPPGQEESCQDQPPMESEQDDITEIVISGDDESTIQESRAPLHQEVNWTNTGSKAWRTRVHNRHLPRSGQQERKRRARLNEKQLCPEE